MRFLHPCRSVPAPCLRERQPTYPSGIPFSVIVEAGERLRHFATHPVPPLSAHSPRQCHPERSAAQWRDQLLPLTRKPTRANHSPNEHSSLVGRNPAEPLAPTRSGKRSSASSVGPSCSQTPCQTPQSSAPSHSFATPPSCADPSSPAPAHSAPLHSGTTPGQTK